MTTYSRLPALALFADAVTTHLEGRWIMRPWNRGENRPARGPPWRFHTRKDAEDFARTNYPGLRIQSSGGVNIDGLHSLWL